MFKQLRRRLLLMNLVMISVVMGIAFSTIYYMTYRDIKDSIQLELLKESTLGDIEVLGDRLPPSDGDIHDGHKDGPDPMQKDLRGGFERVDDRGGDRVVTFSLNVDEEGAILNTNSMVEREDAFYEEILDLVEVIGNEDGHLSFENNEWSFLVTQKEGFVRYSFVDMTTERAVLDRLVLTFLAVSIFTFIMIVIVSNIMTNRSLKPVRNAFDKQKRFISDASHELKTPLAVIRANVEVLLGEAHSEEDRKWLTYIQSEVERMGKLTNDLLYLTQVENDETLELLQVETVLNDPIERMMLGLEPICFEKKIELDYEIEDPIVFKGNAEQFVQLALILMDNAIKYTPKGGNVFLKLHKSNNHINLIVRNTGAGIKEEDIPYLFDRFYRVDKARSRNDGSYGLGLSIARAIAEQHNGKIKCESIPFLETTFTVTLPL